MNSGFVELASQNFKNNKPKKVINKLDDSPVNKKKYKSSN